METSEKTHDELIDELSSLAGIIEEFWDIYGNRHTPSTNTKKAILRAMKFAIDSPEAVEAEIERQRELRWRRLIPPVTVISVNDQPFSIPLCLPVPPGEEGLVAIHVSVDDEQGRRDTASFQGTLPVIEERWLGGERYVRMLLQDCGGRGLGYHSLSVLCTRGSNTSEASSLLVVAPDSCYIPPELQTKRTWGYSLNLYSLRSQQNWGFGDLTDLRRFVEWSGSQGAGFTGINPLHATANRSPLSISPYAPISRLYRNFLYLALPEVAEVKETSAILKRIRSRDFSAELDKLRTADLIEYEAVASVKAEILRLAFDVFYKRHYLRNTPRAADFKAYITAESDSLRTFAIYLVLSERFRRPSEKPTGNITSTADCYAWQGWPQELRHPCSDAVRIIEQKEHREMLFHMYVQWLLDDQLRATADLCHQKAMPLGIYHDLAIGSVAEGSDGWNYQDDIAFEMEVGAPPDDFNKTGQSWGFPPYIPHRLIESGYDFLIKALRKNMQHCGALRIDHALGLFRLFWIPRGKTASEGAYVEYPTEDILRLIALESVRNKTLIIAEDLGTIGGNVRETLQRFSMLSYRLLYFERNYPEFSFLAPDRYPEMALCSVTTHDLPTVNGYWTARDILLKRELGLFCQDEWFRFLSERERDRRLLLEALKAMGLLGQTFIDPAALPPMSANLRQALYEYLAMTPCKVISVSLDDVTNALDQQNLPGVVGAYPNWRRKVPVLLEDIFTSPALKDLARALLSRVC